MGRGRRPDLGGLGDPHMVLEMFNTLMDLVFSVFLLIVLNTAAWAILGKRIRLSIEKRAPHVVRYD